MELGLGVDCLSYVVLWVMSPALKIIKIMTVIVAMSDTLKLVS